MIFLRPFSNIIDGERRYVQRLRATLEDPRSVVRLYRDLHRITRRLREDVARARRHAQKSSRFLTRVLNDYQQAFESRHEELICWVEGYLAFWGESSGPYRERESDSDALRRLKHLLDQKGPFVPGASQRRVARLLDRFFSLGTVCRQWHECLKALSHDLPRALRAARVMTVYECQDLFARLLCQKAANLAGLSQEARWLTDDLRGYRPQIAGHVPAWEEPLERVLRNPLRRFRRRQRRTWLLSGGSLLGVLLAGGLVMSMISWDPQWVKARLWGVGGLWRKDPLALTARARKEFFQGYLEGLDFDEVNRSLERNSRRFVARRQYFSADRYLVFSRDVLKDFFLLLPRFQGNAGALRQAVEASAYLDARLEGELEDLLRLYQRDKIYAKELRRSLLALRRELVRHKVFPFMFLTVHQESPYILVFPERIDYHYFFSKTAMRHIGMSPGFYARKTSLPIMSFVVDGKSYPFKDRAGYFEGEFAVVFRSLSENVEWTAHHEIAHVTDQLRHKYEGLKRPDNTEVNAVLFPLIFSSQRKDYIRDYLWPRLKHPRRLDAYTQAAKGIFNGFLIVLSEPSNPRTLIDDRFNPALVDTTAQRILSLPSQEIRRIALRLYRNPERLLSTAKAARYLAVRTATGEVITGVHGIARRTYVLKTDLGGLFPSGPRFIEGDQSALEDVSGFDLAAFVRSVLRIVFFQGEGLKRATKAEALAAAVTVFVLFEGGVVGLHILGGGIRRRKFHGQDLAGLVEKLYENHPWAEGLGYAGQGREQDVLKEALTNFQGDPLLRKKIEVYKETAGAKARFLFDVCLCLAARNPRAAAIKSRWHDLLFFLPFIGPVLARSPKIFPSQRAFQEKEEYNKAVTRWAGTLSEEKGLEEACAEFLSVIAPYQVSGHTEENAPDIEEIIDDLRRRVLRHLEQPVGRDPWEREVRVTRSSQRAFSGTEFIGLSPYGPGDDVRRLDWRRAAGYPGKDLYIRRYGEASWRRVNLVVDLRRLGHVEGRQRWAGAFSRVVRLLAAGVFLEKTVVIFPDGSRARTNTRLMQGQNRYAVAGRLLDHVRGVWQERGGDVSVGAWRDLRFYDAEENRLLRQRIAWTGLFGSGEFLTSGVVSAQGQEIDALVIEA